jgi:16S rRNA (uracil1498-N3)-methyltransferase
MTRRRWIADECSGDRAYLLGDHAEHLVRVLRAQIGQTFDIAVAGIVRVGRIVNIAPEIVEFELGDPIDEPNLPQVTIALALFKFDRFEWAIEKLTELGATTILPVIAKRTDPHLVTAAAKRLDRWRRVALSASEQSRRASPPEILEIQRLRDLLSRDSGTRIVLSEYAPAHCSLGGVLSALPNDAKRDVVLAFGPEGGWTEDELKVFKENGWIEASLGSNILRAETAAIAAMAIASAQLSR